MNPITAATIAFAVLGAMGFGLWMQAGTIKDLRANAVKHQLEIASCKARLSTIQKDRNSDAQVDNMPDLRDVPPGWLMPQPGAGGLY